MAEMTHIEPPVRRRLLQELADGAFHSGQALAGAAGVSRAAIWKQMQALAQAGLGVESVRGRGYRLTHAIAPLDRDSLLAELPSPWRERLSLHLLDCVDSTSAWLDRQDITTSQGPVACLAEGQVDGRGRRGRGWACLYAAGIPLSLRWRFEALDVPLSGLTPSLAVSLARALEGLGAQGIGLKWPNDLLCEAGKLAGILVEVRGEPAGPCELTLGIGLNWQAPTGVDQPVAGLDRVFPAACPDRSRVAGRVLACLCEDLARFAEEGFAAFQAQWQARDVFREQDIVLQLHHRRIHGRALGLDADGALRLQDDQGQVERWQVGEVSARLEDTRERERVHGPAD